MGFGRYARELDGGAHRGEDPPGQQARAPAEVPDPEGRHDGDRRNAAKRAEDPRSGDVEARDGHHGGEQFEVHHADVVPAEAEDSDGIDAAHDLDRGCGPVALVRVDTVGHVPEPPQPRHDSDRENDGERCDYGDPAGACRREAGTAPASGYVEALSSEERRQ